MTLVETMIAVLILGMFMSGVFALILQSIQSTNAGREHYAALVLCKNRLETAYTFGFDRLTSLRETATVCDGNGAANPDGRYRRRTEVTTSYSSKANLTDVRVIVTIWDRKANAFSNNFVEVQSLFTKVTAS